MTIDEISSSDQDKYETIKSLPVNMQSYSVSRQQSTEQRLYEDAQKMKFGRKMIETRKTTPPYYLSLGLSAPEGYMFPHPPMLF